MVSRRTTWHGSVDQDLYARLFPVYSAMREGSPIKNAVNREYASNISSGKDYGESLEAALLQFRLIKPPSLCDAGAEEYDYILAAQEAYEGIR